MVMLLWSGCGPTAPSGGMSTTGMETDGVDVDGASTIRTGTTPLETTSAPDGTLDVTGDSSLGDSTGMCEIDLPEECRINSSCPEPCERHAGPNDVCNILDDDCPMGQKCVMSSDTNTICQPLVVPTLQLYESCELEGSRALDPCDRGMKCLAAYCVGLCQCSFLTPTCADPEASCLMASETDVLPCPKPCDLLIQDCPSGTRCGFLGAFPICGTLLGAVGIGEICAGDPVCAPGTACMDNAPGCPVDAYGCCTPYCDLDDLDACADLPGDAECAPVDSACVDGVGVCIAA